MENNLVLNEYQSTLEELNFDMYPEEIKEQFYEYISTVPYIKNLISKDRPRAKDLPRDEEGKIIIDLTNPHIIEDTDYFRQSAINFQKYGKYTNLRPNPNPNSEFGKWFKEEVRRCYYGLVRESDGEWITGDYYFFLNYCPIAKVKTIKGKTGIRVYDFPDFWEGHYLKFHYINKARSNGKHGTEMASRGKGKAHPYSQKVLTPEGWKLWKDIHIGDYLYGDDGKPTRVLDIPYDEMSDIYKITLKDGREVFATSGHLFKVKNHKKKKITLNTVQELMSEYKSSRKVSNKNPNGVEYNCRIPVNKYLDFAEKPITIDPYTLGFLLGDGCFRTTKSNGYVNFTSTSEDVDTYINNIPYPIKKITSDEYTYNIQLKVSLLKEYKLWGLKSEDKFIPDSYLFNSVKNRLELLRGLMDSDGEVDNNGIPIFNTTSEKLKDGVVFIARSLGYNVLINKHKSKFNDITYRDHYRIRVLTNDPIFKLERKLKLLTDFRSGYSRSNRDSMSIINIEYSHKEMAKCVTVDNKSNCYLIGDFVITHNSFSLAALLAKRFIFGESPESNTRTESFCASYRKDYLIDDGVLNKFESYIHFCSENTEFPSRRRVKDSINEMQWRAGYKDLKTGNVKGTLNEVIGISVKDSEGKLRGKRGALIGLEEIGSFPNLLGLYGTLRPSMEDGDIVFGMIFGQGTAGDKDSDFTAAQSIMYSPKGFNMQEIPNVYDKVGTAAPDFVYFFPAFMNRNGCYNKDGVSDVTKALLEVLINRYNVKYNNPDFSVVTKTISEHPIVPQEAVLRARGNMFPVSSLQERLNQLKNNPNEYDDVYVGTLVLNTKGKVEFKPTSELPIRKFPTDDNKVKGAIEIFQMPKLNRDGEVPQGRYILGHDPVDQDAANTMSLTSTFVLDLYTDTIVAEYTGRQSYAEENYEIVRLLCMFYNAKCLYEAHPYSQIVNTPDGIKLWKDIKVGDTLFSPTKGTVKVINIPVDEYMKIYKVILVDGREVYASDNHIWTIYKGTSKKSIEMTTAQMMETGLKNKHNQHLYYISEHSGVEYEYKKVLIDPYTMGLILSEGSLRGGHCGKNYVQISSSEEDMLFYKNNIPYKCSHIGKKGYSWHLYINECKNIMVKYGLYNTDSHNKFIPKEYLHSNRVQRMELLKGLMDGDGHASCKGSSIFITCSEQLADDVMSLCRSLGIKSWLQTSRPGVFRVAIASEYKIFKLPRKVVNQHVYNPYTKGSKSSALLYKTAIANIEYSHEEMGKCVTVDSEDGLYLIGDYVVTHNCNKKGIFAYFSKMNSAYMLADTPEYLRDKQLVKYSSFGNNAKGVNANAAINNYANERIKDWLLKPITKIIKEDGEDKEVTMPNLYNIRNMALLQELIAFNPDINVDRVRALGMVMLYREEKMILYQGSIDEDRDSIYMRNYLGNDPFFSKNYDIKYKQ